MGDRAVDDIDHGDTNTEDTHLGGTTSLDTTEHRRQGGRRRPQRIGEEIELYCNPFVEVYGRLSMWVRRLARRLLEKVVGVVMGVQENVVWREILYVVDHTAW